jgi:phosphatidylethanolamine-binding protein (PEBP) family uncharacterized protein
MCALRRSQLLVCLVLAALVASCSGDGRNLREPIAGQTAPPLATTSSTTPPTTQPGGERLLLLLTPTMTPEGPMPAAYTCGGEGISPPLSWAGVPDEAVSLAIVAEELEDAGAVRWLVAGLDPAITGVSEGRLPVGAVGGGGEAPTWDPPCPPAGEQHTIVFTLYVLGEQIDLASASTLDDALATVQLASVEQAAATTTVTGTETSPTSTPD